MRLPSCVCGAPADTLVEVEWASGARRYRYCFECAQDIVDVAEGISIVSVEPTP